MNFLSCILADGITTPTTGLQEYVVNCHIWNDNDAKSCIVVWISFFSFLLAKANYFLCRFAQSKTKLSTMKYHVMIWKSRKKILAELFEYIWKSLFNLVDAVFYICPLQLMMRPSTGVSFLCKQPAEKTWVTWVERRRCHSYLPTGIVWFTITVPAFGVKIRQFSSYFRAVCFHAFSRYFLPISHGLDLVV